ncbi:S1 RNA-binding domain-containing protein [Bacillus salitolerans]|uniref:S1 RNA-binding domain-containing protein n=1 Tax=Bacillus salitolerans TaxID=1437434 RepID=A0ABW4LJF4_9BACI
MIIPGLMQDLEVSREVDFGYYVTDGTDEVLLPTNEIIGEIDINEAVHVFIYHDHQGRLISTMKTPHITLDTYEWVDVVEVREDLGVFINIGLTKDILVSKDDLPLFEEVWPDIGDKLYCSLKQDKNGRLLGKLATDPVMRDISVSATREAFNRNVKGVVFRTVKVGTYMYTDEKFIGFIHESQRSTEPRLGQRIEGRIIDIKEDGTVNISLLPRKHEALDEDSTVILDYMETRGGAMPFWDKSNPEDIEARFNMSKGAFKRALGKLMKDNKVYQEEGWTYFTTRK